ncbi:MAG: hypothetical protein HQL32_03385 [Planctomycetes bacterium]|nr:hypothetical protein [Planctomycetota bacterium]
MQNPVLIKTNNAMLLLSLMSLGMFYQSHAESKVTAKEFCQTLASVSQFNVEEDEDSLIDPSQLVLNYINQAESELSEEITHLEVELKKVSIAYHKNLNETRNLIRHSGARKAQQYKDNSNAATENQSQRMFELTSQLHELNTQLSSIQQARQPILMS